MQQLPQWPGAWVPQYPGSIGGAQPGFSYTGGIRAVVPWQLTQNENTLVSPYTIKGILTQPSAGGQTVHRVTGYNATVWTTNPNIWNVTFYLQLSTDQNILWQDVLPDAANQAGGGYTAPFVFRWSTSFPIPLTVAQGAAVSLRFVNELGGVGWGGASVWATMNLAGYTEYYQ